MVDPVAILTLISDQAVAIQQLSQENQRLNQQLAEKDRMLREWTEGK